jgi:hypothetical protein
VDSAVELGTGSVLHWLCGASSVVESWLQTAIIAVQPPAEFVWVDESAASVCVCVCVCVCQAVVGQVL